MPLTDAEVRNVKPADKPHRLYDIGNLYLEVAPTGGKLWRFKYRFGGKEKRLALGVYPEVSLKEARDRRDRARALLRDDVDPSLRKQEVKAAQVEAAENSFEVVAREWYTLQATKWVPDYSRTVIRRLERDVFPGLRGRPITAITPPELLDILRRIEKRGAQETAHRILVLLGQVFRYAVITSRVVSDPSRDLRGALLPVEHENLAAITDRTKVGPLLVKLGSYKGTHVVRSALRLAPLTFVRPGELRKARWADIDLNAAEWRFTPSKTKAKIKTKTKKNAQSHIVPLSKQAVAILRELKRLTGNGEWVFPGARRNGRPMSDNAVLSALRIMEIPKEEMCGHGFRAMARTILDEHLGERVDIIEHQLAHKVRDALGTAYNRTQFLPERRAMMQRWADYLDELMKKERKKKERKKKERKKKARG